MTSMCQRTCAKPQRKRFSKATVTGKIVSLMLNAFLKTAKTQSCHSLITVLKGFMEITIATKSLEKPNPFQAHLCVSSTLGLFEKSEHPAETDNKIKRSG